MQAQFLEKSLQSLAAGTGERVKHGMVATRKGLDAYLDLQRAGRDQEVHDRHLALGYREVWNDGECTGLNGKRERRGR